MINRSDVVHGTTKVIQISPGPHELCMVGDRYSLLMAG